ncbi:MAG: peptidylprolyl isomerase [Magnetococcales bacterium]|nr:peptidylprolyl isomerase [Magnetococcales bacterium]
MITACFFRLRPFSLLFVVALGVTLLFTTHGMAQTLDRIVAVVKAENFSAKEVKADIITQSEIDEAIAPLLEQFRQSGEQVDVAKIEKKARDELILNALRKQKAEQLSITVNDADIDALMASVERSNNLPSGSLPDVLRRQGIDLEKYRQGLSNKLLQSRLINRTIRPLITVSEEEIQSLYKATSNQQTGVEELRLGQILLGVDQNASPEQLQQTQEKSIELANRLKQGESLSTLASQFSDDPSGLNGGDMGWFKRGQLIPAIENAVFILEEGGVTAPLRSPQGFHIFTVIERRIVQPNRSENTKFKVKARHILIPVPQGEDDQPALEGILKIRQLFMDGEASFAELAKRYSKDGTAKSGGDLGWFSEGKMVPEFEKAAFALPVDVISAPVRTAFGWHLILLDEKQALSPDSLEANRTELKNRVMESKIQMRYKQWLRDLLARAFVEFR